MQKVVESLEQLQVSNLESLDQPHPISKQSTEPTLNETEPNSRQSKQPTLSEAKLWADNLIVSPSGIYVSPKVSAKAQPKSKNPSQPCHTPRRPQTRSQGCPTPAPIIPINATPISQLPSPSGAHKSPSQGCIASTTSQPCDTPRRAKPKFHSTQSRHSVDATLGIVRKDCNDL